MLLACYLIVVPLYDTLDLQLHVQSAPITTNVVSSNPVHGEVYYLYNNVVLAMSMPI
jgi:hypothetical protein